MSTTNILDLNNRIDALEKNSGGGSADSAKRSDIATEFSATTAYTAGCFVYYEGKLYQFNADHAAGAWDPTDVVEANVTDQVVSNASAIAGLTASDVGFDNTESGLAATNVQGAVDELSESYPASKVMLSDGVTSVVDLVDISAEITNLATNVTIESAVYKNGLVIIDGTIPANFASATNIFNISSKYKPIGSFSVPCIRAELSGGIVNYSISNNVFIYYKQGQAYTAESIFHLVYFCN